MSSANAVYLAEQIHEALANDSRVGELDIEVRVAADHVYIRGTITTEERRQAVSEIVSGVVPDLEVRNDLTAGVASDHPGVEKLQ